MSDEEKKIIIDEDWKAQVEAEKQAAAHKPDAPAADASEPPAQAGGGSAPPTDAGGSPGDDPEMPPASIGMLMSSLATEALVSLGQFPHPATGEVVVRRNQAKYLIDTLAMLKEKTAGNLTPEEAIALDDVVHQLRMAFVATK